VGIYDKYFKVVTMTRLPPDPRVRARALAFALLCDGLGMILAFEVPTLVLDVLLGSRLPGATLDRFLPTSFVFWEIDYDLGVTYKSAALDAMVHNAFHVAQVAGTVTFFLGLVAGVFAYRMWCNRTDGLTTERGDARWMLPEDLLDIERPEDSLLPDNYDLRRGFSRDHRAERGIRTERAAALHQAREIATQDDVAQERLHDASIGKP
jgi:hypothetical protein